MGSLMAGWDSPTQDRKSVRNHSLTKEEIKAYWKEDKKTKEEQVKEIVSEPKFQRSISLPLANAKETNFVDEEDLRRKVTQKKNAWWTRSNSAFLNEPPVFEGNNKRYASQFHITNLTN